MHELSIAISMVERVLEEVESRGGLRVEAVHLKLGVLSGVDRDALAFSYEVACEGTSLAGTRLITEVVPLAIFCDVCHAEGQPVSIQEICCPRCGTPSQRILRGRELELTALEVAA